MITPICFIFFYEKSHEYLSLKLNAHGSIEAPLLSRPIEAIQTLQDKTKTYIVIPAKHIGIHYAKLPWLSEKKAKTALLYAIEEKLSESIDNIHIAFDKTYYVDGIYLTSVCQSAYLNTLMATLNEQAIQFDTITSDFFALHAKETIVIKTSGKERGILINSPLFNGFLPLTAITMLDTYQLTEHNNSGDDILQSVNPTEKPCRTEACLENGKAYPNKIAINQATVENTGQQTIYHFPSEADSSYHRFIAERLQKIPTPFNIARGLCGTQTHTAQRWLITASFLLVFSAFTWTCLHLIALYQTNHAIKSINQQITTLYRELFPNSHKVINPRFRTQTLLKEQQRKKTLAYWLVLNTLAEVKNSSTFEVVSYTLQQNNTIQLQLIMHDFETLQKIQAAFQEKRIFIQQNDTSEKAGDIISNMTIIL